MASRLSLAVVHLQPLEDGKGKVKSPGTGSDPSSIPSSSVTTVTVVASLANIVKLVPKVRVLSKASGKATSPPSSSPVPAVTFDRYTQGDVLSLTASIYGAVTIPTKSLTLTLDKTLTLTYPLHTAQGPSSYSLTLSLVLQSPEGAATGGSSGAPPGGSAGMYTPIKGAGGARGGGGGGGAPPTPTAAAASPGGGRSSTVLPKRPESRVAAFSPFAKGTSAAAAPGAGAGAGVSSSSSSASIIPPSFKPPKAPFTAPKPPLPTPVAAAAAAVVDHPPPSHTLGSGGGAGGGNWEGGMITPRPPPRDRGAAALVVPPEEEDEGEGEGGATPPTLEVPPPPVPPPPPASKPPKTSTSVPVTAVAPPPAPLAPPTAPPAAAKKEEEIAAVTRSSSKAKPAPAPPSVPAAPAPAPTPAAPLPVVATIPRPPPLPSLGGTFMPCRLVDYFAVSVSVDREERGGEEGGEGGSGGGGGSGSSSNSANNSGGRWVGLQDSSSWNTEDPGLDYAAPWHGVGGGGGGRGGAGKGRGGKGGKGRKGARGGNQQQQEQRVAGVDGGGSVGGEALGEWCKAREGVPHSFQFGEEGQVEEGHPDDSDEGEGEGGAAGGGEVRRTTPRRPYKRRVAEDMFRYPKTDHEDLKFQIPQALFPAGVAPIQSVARPPTRKFMFVVAGEGRSGKHYCVCLTAYRREDSASAAASSGGGRHPGSGSVGSTGDSDSPSPAAASTPNPGGVVESQWWPVALFMLTRFPIAPQLQCVLERIWDVYDQGQLVEDLERGEVKEAEAWCSLQEYLRMLVYETPVPIRRVNAATTFFLPGPTPSPHPSGCVTVYLPPPDSLPAVPFHAPAALLATFPPTALLAFLSALLLSRPLVVVGRSVQQLCEVQECAIALLYPLSKAAMHVYIPIFNVTNGPHVLLAPGGICTGVLTAFVSKLFTALHDVDTYVYNTLVVVDATEGRVDVGCAPILARRALKRLGRVVEECSGGEGGGGSTSSSGSGSSQGEEEEEGEEGGGAKGGGGLAALAKAEAQRRMAALHKALGKAENRLREGLIALERGEEGPGGEQHVLQQLQQQHEAEEEDKGEEEGGEGEDHVWFPPDLAKYPWGDGSATVEVASTLAFPEPIHSSAAGELAALIRTHKSGTGAATKDYNPKDGVSLQRANLGLQALCARVMATLLHGTRSHTFFPGEGYGRVPYLEKEGPNGWVESKIAALVASTEKRLPKQGPGMSQDDVTTAALKRSALAAVAGSPLARKFLNSLCESQFLGSLLDDHCTVFNRPFHALTATFSNNPTLEESSKWTPPVALPATTLVVPPPLGGDDLVPWQVALKHLRAPFPAEANSASLPPLPALDPPPVAKAGKKKPRVPIRQWPSQDAARAMGMSSDEASTLERLLSVDAAEREKNPEEPGGDDIGVEVESKEEPEVNEAEEKMYKRLHSWLREAVWQHKVSKDEEHSPAAAQQQQQDWFRASSKTVAKSFGAAFAASKGYEWTPYEEEISQMLKAPLPRAAFVRLLQMQVMYAAGLQTPLKGARGVQLQLQPLLGMGVSDAILAKGSFTSSTHLVSSSSQSFKTLLVLSLPPQCFGRLVSMMAVLVEEAATDSDFPVAGALLQVSGAFSCGKQYGHRVLASQALWKDAAFWESYVYEALSVEMQETRVLVGDTSSAAPRDDFPPAIVVSVLTSLIVPMLTQGLSPSDTRAVMARTCAKCGVVEGEAGDLYKLLDAASGAPPSLGPSDGGGGSSASRDAAGGQHSMPSPDSAAIKRAEEAALVAEKKREEAAKRRAEDAAALEKKKRADEELEAERRRAEDAAEAKRLEEVAAEAKRQEAVAEAKKQEAAAEAKRRREADEAAAASQAPPPVPQRKMDEKPQGVVSPPLPSAEEDDTSGPVVALAAVAAAPPPPPPPSPPPPPPPSNPPPVEQHQEPPPPPSTTTPPPLLLHPWAGMPEPQAMQAAASLLQHRRFPTAPPPIQALAKTYKKIGATDPILLGAARMESACLVCGDVLESEMYVGVPDTAVLATPSIEGAATPKNLFGKMAAAFGAGKKAGEAAAAATAAAADSSEGSGGSSTTTTTTTTQPPAVTEIPHSTSSTPRVFSPEAKRLGPLRAALAMMRKERKESRTTSSHHVPSLSMANLTLRGHAPGASLSSLGFDADTGRLVTGGTDGRVSLWSMSPTRRGVVHAYGEHGGMVTATRIVGDLVVSGSEDGYIRLCSFPRPHPFGVPVEGEAGGGPTIPPQHFAIATRLRPAVIPSPVTALDAWQRLPPPAAADSPGGGGASDKPPPPLYPLDTHYLVAGGTADGRVVLYSADWRIAKTGVSGAKALELSSHTNLHRSGTPVESVRLSLDGQLCVSAGRDGKLGIINTPTGKTWTMSAPKPPTVVGGGGGGLFGRSSSSSTSTPITPAEPINPYLLPSGLPLVTAWADTTSRPVYIFSGGTDGTARVWDLRTGGCVLAFPSGSPIWCMEGVPGRGRGLPVRDASGELTLPGAPLGDRLLITGHEDGLVRRWDSRKAGVPDGVWGGVPGAHKAVLCMAAVEDLVVTGGGDGSVRLWDAATGDQLLCRGHTGPVARVAIQKDFVYSAGYDGLLKAWAPETWKERRAGSIDEGGGGAHTGGQ